MIHQIIKCDRVYRGGEERVFEIDLNVNSWTLDIRADSNLKMLSQIEKTDEVIPMPGCNSQEV